MNEVWESRHLLWVGLKLTLQLSAVAILVSSVLGLFVGVGLVYGNRVDARWLTGSDFSSASDPSTASSPTRKTRRAAPD